MAEIDNEIRSSSSLNVTLQFSYRGEKYAPQATIDELVTYCLDRIIAYNEEVEDFGPFVELYIDRTATDNRVTSITERTF